MYEKYAKNLKENRLKITPQRLEILEYLDMNRIHPTPEDIYDYAKSKFPGMSKMTVYNIIESLVGKKIISTMRMVNSSALHVDYDTDVHMHFICEKCKNIYDLKMDLDYSNKVEEFGHTVNDCKVNVYGICKECLETDKSN